MNHSYDKDKLWKVIPSWMNDVQAYNWKEILINQIIWERPSLKVFGQNYIIPRKTGFLGEKGITYRYSGHIHYGLGWPEWFLPLLYLIKEETNIDFNGCLLNLYRNGDDRMGWHSDNEIEIDSSKTIASLSLGAKRDFIFKHKSLNLKCKLSLANGDLLLMLPGCQNKWLHS